IHSISGERFLAALASGSPLYDLDTLAAYVEEDRKLLDAVRPDFVVGDMRLSLAVSARLSQVPYVTVANAHWSPYTTRRRFPIPELPLTRMLPVPFCQAVFDVARPFIFGVHARPYKALQRRHGQAPLKGLLDAYTHGDYTLYADLPALVPTAGLPEHHRYLGPVLW